MTKPADDPYEPLALRTLVWRTIVALVVIGVVAGVSYVLLKDPLEAFSAVFVAKYGLVGIFVGVALLDAIPMTLHEPLLLFGVAGGLGFGPVLLTAASASVLAGCFGWLGGRVLGRFAPVQRLLAHYRLPELLARYGIAAVAVAALTPFPFAIATWGAGAAGMPFRSLLIGALFRFPKVAFYLSAMTFPWLLPWLRG